MERHHHHNHGKNASVPAKGTGRAIPGEHWEIKYRPEEGGKNTVRNALTPKCAKDRPTPHIKVNECDH